ncbi:MAG: hypothetical protein U0Y68_20825 [Blastocatellia bacterium]
MSRKKATSKYSPLTCRCPCKGGYGSFEYPAGVAFDRDRFKAFPVEVVASYQIDAPTYDDYRLEQAGSRQ